MKKTKVGVIGCGNISGIYFQSGKVFDILDVVACADVEPERAKAKAEEFGIPKACSVKEILADPEIEIIMNLTPPAAHAEIALAALKAGKHIHNEKPLAVKREDGKKIIALAKEKGLRVGCAPDTFMGAGLQTCRKIIDDGWIGVPVAATAFFMGRGPERWHPNPEFFYEPGGGPMFDMGPYYLTALVHLLGPMKSVVASTRISFPERIAGCEAKRGQRIKVKIPTHISGTIDFAQGAIGTIITSFDVWPGVLPNIEIYGSEGTMQVPDPNGFGGNVRVRLDSDGNWRDMPLTHGYADQSRGIGVADMAYGLRSGRQHRTNGDMAFHVLDAMHSFHDASNEGKRIVLKSTCEQPRPLPMELRKGLLDE